MSSPKVLTIGHSNHDTGTFLKLLLAHGVERVIDVRSTPYSRRVPQFNRENLKNTLQHEGITYTFMGNSLGGRPQDPAHFGSNGRADYRQISQTPQFRTALQRLEAASVDETVATLCTEKDPRNCHRTLMVGHELAKNGVEVKHILADGSLITHTELVTDLVSRFRLPLPQQSIPEDHIQQKAMDLQANRVAYKR